MIILSGPYCGGPGKEHGHVKKKSAFDSESDIEENKTVDSRVRTCAGVAQQISSLSP